MEILTWDSAVLQTPRCCWCSLVCRPHLVYKALHHNPRCTSASTLPPLQELRLGVQPFGTQNPSLPRAAKANIPFCLQPRRQMVLNFLIRVSGQLCYEDNMDVSMRHGEMRSSCITQELVRAWIGLPWGLEWEQPGETLKRSAQWARKPVGW